MTIVHCGWPHTNFGKIIIAVGQHKKISQKTHFIYRKVTLYFLRLLQKDEDKSLHERLRLRAKVQVAQIARLRPGQRLQGNIHGLVPISVLLRLQVWSTESKVSDDDQSKLRTNCGSVCTKVSRETARSFGWKQSSWLWLSRPYASSTTKLFRDDPRDSDECACRIRNGIESMNARVYEWEKLLLPVTNDSGCKLILTKWMHFGGFQCAWVIYIESRAKANARAARVPAAI